MPFPTCKCGRPIYTPKAEICEHCRVTRTTAPAQPPPLTWRSIDSRDPDDEPRSDYLEDVADFIAENE